MDGMIPWSGKFLAGAARAMSTIFGLRAGIPRSPARRPLLASLAHSRFRRLGWPVVAACAGILNGAATGARYGGLSGLLPDTGGAGRALKARTMRLGGTERRRAADNATDCCGPR